ncbi:MAG: transaldolase family protein [Pseudonocardia sp.]
MSGGPGWPAAAVTRCRAEGISINVTLILSRRRYIAAMDAFLDGINLPRATGQDLSRIASVASIFVRRVDAEIDRRVDAIDPVERKALRGTAATDGGAVGNRGIAHDDTLHSLNATAQ